MRPQEWEAIVVAIVKLGGTLVYNTEDHVWLEYGFDGLFAIRKCPVTIAAQKAMLENFHLDQQTYIAALKATKK